MEKIRYNPAQGLEVGRQADFDARNYIPGTIVLDASQAVWLARALLIAAHGNHKVAIVPTTFNPDA